MATTTTNLGLTKPDVSDAADIGVLNANFDKIDELGGYGIGRQTSKFITPATLLSAITIGGMYYWNAENTDPDKPFSAGDLFVVPRANSTYINQFAFGRDSSIFQIKIRQRTASGWRPWTNASPSAFAPANLFSIYVANGLIVDDESGYLRGIGTATVTIEGATGLARIDFSIQITVSGEGTTDFTYGINRDVLRTINPNIPLIKPITGGVVTVYGASDSGATVSQAATHFGGLPHGHSGGKYWNLSRIYDLASDGITGAVGAWPQSTFAKSCRWVGTCYGRVEG